MTFDCDRGHDEWKHETCAYCGGTERDAGELLVDLDTGELVCDDCDQDRDVVVDVAPRPEYL